MKPDHIMSAADAGDLSVSDIIRPVFGQGLANLSHQIARAEAHAADESSSLEALLKCRLAPDMHPLAAQVSFAAHQVRECLARMSGQDLPELRMAKTVSSTRDVIDDALAALWESDRQSLEAGLERSIEIRLPDQTVFELTGRAYLADWALPQFYFHLVTAYAILRHEGVPLGKADYVPHMVRHLRAGAA